MKDIFFHIKKYCSFVLVKKISHSVNFFTILLYRLNTNVERKNIIFVNLKIKFLIKYIKKYKIF